MATGGAMLFLRLDYESGLHKEYCWADAARATKIYEHLRQCKLKGETALIEDDVGRQAQVDMRKVVSLELGDPLVEADQGFKMTLELKQLELKYQPYFAAFQQEQPPRNGAASGGAQQGGEGYRPGIGSFSG